MSRWQESTKEETIMHYKQKNSRNSCFLLSLNQSKYLTYFCQKEFAIITHYTVVI